MVIGKHGVHGMHALSLVAEASNIEPGRAPIRPLNMEDYSARERAAKVEIAIPMSAQVCILT